MVVICYFRRALFASKLTSMAIMLVSEAEILSDQPLNEPSLPDDEAEAVFNKLRKQLIGVVRRARPKLGRIGRRLYTR